MNEKKQYYNYGADKSPLLTNAGKDKVRMMFRQKIQLPLAPPKQPFSPKTTGTDSDFWLNDSVSGAQRVNIGINKNQKSLFLIIFQEKEDD